MLVNKVLIPLGSPQRICRAVAVFAVTTIASAGLAQDKVDFSRQIRPLLSDRCFLCHGPDEATREAGLRLDIEDDAMAYIEPGDPDSSELFERITSEEIGEGGIMPPVDHKIGKGLKLDQSEIALIKRWIEEGAPWKQHWSFVKPVKPDVPKLDDSPESLKQWPKNEIDRFVLARLRKENFAPAKRATREKLLRRLSFDLTGLPPTLEELDAFLADQSDDAYEKAVDRLLASEAYGERMASDWLDMARYSDTYGYQVDRDRFVWPWRDWVIGAFNRNLPFDQFVIEQLAGDLLPNATDQQRLATTFNRLHPQKVEGGSIEEEFRVEYVADRSQTVGMAFMGLTVECARCHDHKYDPLSQEEYYELFAFFNNIDEAGLYSFFDHKAVPTPNMLLPNDKQKKQLSTQSESVQQLENRLNAVAESEQEAFEKWLNALEERESAAGESIKGQTFVADFQKQSAKRNERITLENDVTAFKLTGDDSVEFDAGKFLRHDPFSVSIRLRVPDEDEKALDKLLKRSVIFHRSKAWTDAASRGYQLLIRDGHWEASLIHFWPGDAISVRTKSPVTAGQWQDIAVTYDGSSRAKGIQIFIDGKKVPVEIVRDNLRKTIIGGEQKYLTIGERFRDIGFTNGLVSDFRVFSRQLSEIEVSEIVDPGSLKRALAQPTSELSDVQRDHLREFFLLSQSEPYAKSLKELTSTRASYNKLVDGIRTIMVMEELEKPRPAYLLNRGAYDDPRGQVQPNTPRIFPPLPEGENANRLGLAKWLTMEDHPLTSRVAVNHFWQLIFGDGLVRTPEDFGSQGQQPTHPQMLDWLAVDFQENGWDVKRLLKQFVMSSTYQQSTQASPELRAADPENRLLARVSTHRLSAEMIRDNVLATGKLLVQKIGGPPVKPYELAASFKPSKPDRGEGLYRRSLYTYWKRTGPAPVMLTLNAATRDVCQVQRERTSSPLAALVQLNNPQTVEAARSLAGGLLNDHKDDLSKIATDLFRTLTSRYPNDTEQEIVESLFNEQLQYFNDNPDAAKKFLSVGQRKIETKQPATLAAWASVVNTLYSFDECVMKR